ncbi:hypothetical protein MN0502_31200 [Arthrobacter sp. MN05-02]|nr:hypothetical protein MN0502_31200 [Arthrobacter sp. MN05-02]
MTLEALPPSAAHQGPVGVATVLLTVVSAFQAALAAGAPWGAAAYGGYTRGTLPARLRVASAVSSLAYLGLALVTADRGSGTTTKRRILTGAAGLMGVGTLMNLASRSAIERLLWTPVAGSLAVALLRIARNLPPHTDRA